MKQCKRCRDLGVGPKSDSEFNKGSDTDGLQNLCREHSREANRAWVKANPVKNRAKGKRFRENNPVASRRIAIRANLKRFYDITPERYDELFTQQAGCCKVCSLALIAQTDETREFMGQPPNEIGRVDHDHETGEVRGLLCFNCNTGIGHFQESEQLLLQAVRYLRESATVQA